MVKIEPAVPPQPPSMEEYIGYLYQNYGPPPANYSLFEFLDGFAWYQEQWHQELFKDLFMEQYFFGDWRKGKEMHKVVITQRFYEMLPLFYEEKWLIKA